jgi:hypothetical protein
MSRLVSAWRALDAERHLAVLAAIGLFVTMFLPWYSKTNAEIVVGAHRSGQASLSSVQTSLSAFNAFSFVEAAVLLVSAGVLVLLWKRADGADFQMPGGDGRVVTVAGAWTALLIFYRLLDKPSLQGTQRVTATVGVEWGIFIALIAAIGLAYAGTRMRGAERPEPPLSRPRAPRRPAEPEPLDPPRRRAAPEAPGAVTPAAQRRRRPAPVPARRPPVHDEPVEQLSFDDAPTRPDRPPGPPAGG